MLEEVDGVREGDRKEMERRLRRMHDDRRSYIHTARLQLRAQAAAVERLREEKRSLDTSLARLTTSEHQIRKAALQQRMAELMEDYQFSIDQNRAHRLRVEQVKKERRRKQEELKNLRARFGGEAIIVRKKDVLKKRVAVLEDRQEHVSQALNVQLKRNEELRKSIAELMAEKTAHNAECRILETALLQGRKSLQAKMDLVSDALNQREEMETRLRSLRTTEAEESAAVGAEMQHLRRFLAHQRKMERFIAQKAASRFPRRHPVVADGGGGEEVVEEERLTFSDLRGVIQDLMESCGVTTSPEDIRRTFLRRDEQNMAFYVYINQLCAQAAALQYDDEERLNAGSQEEIRQMSGNIVRLQESGTAAEEQRAAKRHEMENRVKVVKAETEEIARKRDSSQKLLDLVLEKVKVLHQDIGATHSPLLQLIRGGALEVTAGNVHVVLGAVEERVSEMLRLRDCLHVISASDVPMKLTNLPIPANLAKKQQHAKNQIQKGNGRAPALNFLPPNINSQRNLAIYENAEQPSLNMTSTDAGGLSRVASKEDTLMDWLRGMKTRKEKGDPRKGKECPSLFRRLSLLVIIEFLFLVSLPHRILSWI
ncbi:unnamed protein product [Darwinula stevensoni]|uniref:ODAD1 central coiled coil region domain-containing protein n=1 Tax=Darwinula stevensoni TaxID=69355 RepID=A0A7R8XB21_9CRUS|nr:unnamed protein product [Darwinula stevensoni]CAG0884388.1 unnamed protein product [Darwinula stevensoni]